MSREETNNIRRFFGQPEIGDEGRDRIGVLERLFAERLVAPTLQQSNAELMEEYLKRYP